MRGLAFALDQLGPDVGGLQQFAHMQACGLPDQVVVLERLQQPREVVLQGLLQAEPGRGKHLDQVAAAAKGLIEGGGVQLRLVAEMVADGGHVGPRRDGDGAYRGAGKATFGKQP
ncbi:hypothetical protein D3C87_1660850 [compost metagenome]